MARKILLADDSVTAQNMGRKILADAGYEVITVNNGSAALKKIAEHKPDLIVLDVYMPGYSGLEVCQRLKETQETSRVPVLLTVGKLEPFKPEESKRVRADGFIVKPFEASELLSALSKLEDKIVPRGEGAKPGRLARVTASLDEGKFDRTVAMDDDSGWKNRLSFPSKKKEKSAAEDDQSSAISIEQKAAEKRRANKANEARVDLGALAPEGLPKDVTAEEIAALAAAAAKVKGKIAEFSNAAPALAEKIEERESSDGRAQEVPAAAPVVDRTADRTIEGKREETPAEKIDEKPEERVEATPDKFGEAPAAATSLAATNHADLMAAIAGLDPGDAASSSENSEHGLSSQRTADPIANEPVTMAIAAAAGSTGEPPRWTAVSVAVDKEEAAISLEHEMQKAYAAFAAAVAGEATSSAAVTESPVESVEFAAAKENSLEPQAMSAEPVSSIAAPEPQIAEALPALSNASTEAIRAAVQDLEMISESSPAAAAAAVSTGFESGPAGETEAVSVFSPQAQTSQSVEDIARETSIADVRESEPEVAKVDAAQRSGVDSWTEEARNQEATNQDLNNQDQANHEHEKPVVAAAATGTDGSGADKQFVAASTSSDRGEAELTSASSGSSNETINAQETPAHGEIAKGDSDGAATTAAAWASWRKIRETGDSKASSGEPNQKEVEEAFTLPDAAMAVAAGAEKTPKAEEADSDPAAIASIVDSVLADLRPKIFEEISRKMGKKK